MIKRIKRFKKIRIHREGTDTLLYGFIVIAAIALLLWRFSTYYLTILAGAVMTVVENIVSLRKGHAKREGVTNEQ